MNLDVEKFTEFLLILYMAKEYFFYTGIIFYTYFVCFIVFVSNPCPVNVLTIEHIQNK